MPQHQRVNTSPVYLLLVRLSELATEGCAARAVYNILRPYFVDEQKNNLVFEEVVFDLETDAARAQYRKDIMHAIEGLNRCVSNLGIGRSLHTSHVLMQWHPGSSGHASFFSYTRIPTTTRAHCTMQTTVHRKACKK